MPDPKEKKVSVFDRLKRKPTPMSARELTDSMVYVSRTSADGTSQTGFVDVDQLKPGSLKHPPLSEEMRNALRPIQAAFNEFFPSTLEEWENDFRRDTNPMQEFALWSAAAEAFTAYKAAHRPGTGARRDYHNLMVHSLSTPREYLFNVVTLISITREQGEAFLDECWPHGTPIKT